jgi:hypothetical protein
MANLGKFRGRSATANTTFASGVFTLSRHYQQVKQSLWPFPIFGPIDYLIVGGGGAGGPGQNAGGSFLAITGGGGGGQVQEILAQYFAKGVFPVTIGPGGTAPVNSNTSTPGGDSSFNNTTSVGGGVGAIPPSSVQGGLGSYNPPVGIRGGGSFYFRSNTGFPKIFVRNAPNGGSAAYGSTSTGATLGAGGGAGGGGSTTGDYIGGDGITSAITGLGYGGVGNTSQFSNMPATGYSGTELRGTKDFFGAGYFTGPQPNWNEIGPRPNSGGGGAGFRGSNFAGQSGAAGTVVIRYITGSLSAIGGTTSTSGIYTLHTFTTSGTFTVL